MAGPTSYCNDSAIHWDSGSTYPYEYPHRAKFQLNRFSPRPVHSPPENYKNNNKSNNNNNNDEQTDMDEHLDPLSEQGIQKIERREG